MLHYVARRLVAAMPTLLGVSLVVFMMVRLLPGDPARMVAGVTQAGAAIDSGAAAELLDRYVTKTKELAPA